MSKNQTVSNATMEVAKASYGRCGAAPDFFESFYRTFFEACPEAKPKFANTNFERQHKLLQHAIGLLLIFPTQPDDDPSIMTRVAERHSRRDLDINPSLYPAFLDSLMATVERYDPEFTPDVEQAWRTTIAKGVDYMQSVY